MDKKINRITKKDGKITKTQVAAPKPVYSVRIEPSIYEKVSLLAHLEKRSVTAEVNQLLTESLMRPGTQDFVAAHSLRHAQAGATNEIKDKE